MQYFQSHLHPVSWYRSCISLSLPLAKLVHVQLLQPLKIFTLLPFNFTLLNFAYHQVSSFFFPSCFTYFLRKKIVISNRAFLSSRTLICCETSFRKAPHIFPQKSVMSALSEVGVSYLNYLPVPPGIWMLEVENQILSRGKSAYHY